MSIELANILEAIKILAEARYKVAGVDFAWSKVRHAETYLQKQVAGHFAN